jgi:CRP-like cAMP-binding protein
LQSTEYKNAILKGLDPRSVARLDLKPKLFELDHPFEVPGALIAHLFFVEEGMASMTTSFLDGTQVEVGTFGWESVIGLSGLMGSRRSLNRIFTQVAGRGYAGPLAAAKKEFALGGEFQLLALRSVQAQLLQATQSAGCNARHSFDQRLARWLLITADRVRSNTFPISQEYLAGMLGSSRPTVSISAHELKVRGLIDYRRGVIRILDVAGLEAVACECYLLVKSYVSSLTDFDSGRDAGEATIPPTA